MLTFSVSAPVYLTRFTVTLTESSPLASNCLFYRVICALTILQTKSFIQEDFAHRKQCEFNDCKITTNIFSNISEFSNLIRFLFCFCVQSNKYFLVVLLERNYMIAGLNLRSNSYFPIMR